ncbi:MAG: alkaline phosphatase family protein [Thermodesulfobacteriota bacterium]
MSKVIVIGLDGATLDIIRPLAESGKLPNLSRLMDEGACGELTSTLHPTTPQAWTTFMTGCGAGKHGIYDFIERIPDKYEVAFVNGSFKKVRSLWGLLSTYGKKVGVVNVPFTYPPEEVNGVMISGFDSPSVDTNFTYPEGLYDELVKEIGAYELRGTFPIGKKMSAYRVEHVEHVVNNRTDACTYLMNSREWDLFVVVYGSTDHVQHMFWRQMEEKAQGIVNEETEMFGNIIHDTYIMADKAVGTLLENCGEDTIVMIMSDHGGGRLKRVVNLNNWLEKNGYLVYKKKPLKKYFVDGGKTVAKKYLPRTQRDWIKSRFPGIKNRTESMSYFAEIDWLQTKAYSWGMYGNISLNLKGRERDGLVSPEAYGEVCNEIKARLLKLEDPQSASMIVEKVHMKEDIFTGNYTDRAPDILVQWKDYAYYTQGNLKRGDGDVFADKLYIDSSDFEHSGTHRLNGILLANGPGVIRRGATIEHATLADITPTILYAMGLPIPEEMDGNILKEIFEDEFIKKNIPRKGENAGPSGGNGEGVSSYSEEDKKQIWEKLKGLGYI